MRRDEFPAYLEHGTEYYAGTLVAQAGLPEEAARSKSIADHDSLFANGLDTPDLFVLVVESDGEPVGNVVFGPRERHGRRLAFLYDLHITPEHRGKAAIGTTAMALLREEARALGLERIELNVFGGNEGARRLYQSLGYQETFVTMAKDARVRAGAIAVEDVARRFVVRARETQTLKELLIAARPHRGRRRSGRSTMSRRTSSRARPSG